MKEEKRFTKEDWLTKFTKPLEFAYKNNFQNLHKIKYLEKTLLKFIENLPQEFEPYREKFLELCYGLDQVSLDEKKERIKALFDLCIVLGINKEEPSEVEEPQEEPINQEFYQEPTFSLEEYRQAKEELKKPVQFLKGVGPKVAQKFAKKDIHTIEDLLFFLPRDYEDRRHLIPISNLKEGQKAVVFGEVIKSGVVYTSRRKVFEAQLTDGTGILLLRWFNFKEFFLRNLLQSGKRVYTIGEVGKFGRVFEMVHPEIIPEGEEDKLELELGKIVPVYSAVEGLSERQLRKIIKNAVEDYADFLENFIPREFLKKRRLLPLNLAIKKLHFPEDEKDLSLLKKEESVYHKSLAYDEFFFLELALALKKSKVKKEQGISFRTDGEKVKAFLAKLPFELTSAQKRVLEEIKKDMASPVPMNRLLQGDVGCGKTVIAFIAALIAIDNGYQVAMMAPTEILAEQHYHNFRRYAQLMGVNVALLSGGVPPAKKREIHHGLATGFIDFVIGTHALFQERVEFKRLGLVIIDEQHRFGVLQRAALREKAKGITPDTLVMTATPIPRTLGLTIYGDLDLSIIDEMPKGRKPVITKLFIEYNKHKAYEAVKEELRKGHQAYVILPLIEESEKLDLKAVTTYGEELQTKFFPEFKVGILHGKMSSLEKEKIMHQFKRKEIDILVSTTVVEVGVDVPNATVMVIEHAERFGLSQLHQLRGRVGRGEAQSYCFLIAYKISMESEAYRRLQILCQTNDGFKIAEEDLKLRGPGDFLGTKQSGYLEFKKADLVKDYPILLWAREDAFSLIEKDPDLSKHPILKEELTRRWEERLKLSEIA